jgi:hypothetical protein
MLIYIYVYEYEYRHYSYSKSECKDDRKDSLRLQGWWIGQVLDLGTGAGGTFLSQTLQNEIGRRQDLLS